ncbi:MAG: hypothetical protein WCD31_13490 [Gillisia sp.]
MWLQHPPELPKDKPATPSQQYGFSFWEFVTANKWYLLTIFLILAIFLLSRAYYNRRK